RPPSDPSAGAANHDGSNNSADFTIGKAPSSVTVSCPTTPVTYTGTALEPCSATYTGAGLDPAGLPLSPVTYTDNINVGTAHASVTWAGDANHDGSNNSADFTIGKAPSSVTVSCPTTPVTYTGTALEPCSATYTGAGLDPAGLPLSPVTYTDNINVGTAHASTTEAHT